MDFDLITDMLFIETGVVITEQRHLHSLIGFRHMALTGRQETGPLKGHDGVLVPHEYTEIDIRRATAAIRVGKAIGEGSGRTSFRMLDAVQGFASGHYGGVVIASDDLVRWIEKITWNAVNAYLGSGSVFLIVPCYVSVLRPSKMPPQETGETAR